MPSLEQLNSRFAKPGIAFVHGHGDLIKAVVSVPWAAGELYLHGAHVTHFQPAGQQPVLWMSQRSNFEACKPIRGGVPICFPWFGPHPEQADAPAHGLARTAEWTLASTDVDEANQVVTLELVHTLQDHFQCRLRARFGQQLELTFTCHWHADASAATEYQIALHSYLAVDDVRNVHISGLESTGFIDKVDGGQTKPATGSVIRFDGELDRVYFDADATCILHDPGLKRRILVSKLDAQDTVVWNPWIAKAARMPDFGDDEWPEMVCIETAQIIPRRVAQPGDTYSITTRIAVEN